MKPLKNNIIIKPNVWSKSASGLYIPEQSTEKVTAKVIAVGEGTPKNPMTVKKGDTVSYRKDTGHKIDWEGQHYLLINEAHVIAIL